MNPRRATGGTSGGPVTEGPPPAAVLPAIIHFRIEPFDFAVQGCIYHTEPGIIVGRLDSGQARLAGAVPGAGEPAGERTEGRPRYRFRWTGRDWEVVVEGGRGFHLPNVLGSRLLDYMLHHPNETIASFDLELAVQPEKAQARAPESIQPASDAKALRQYRQRLERLRAERQQAQAAGDPEAAGAVGEEIAALELALKGERALPDAGKRARDNVRKAIGLVTKHLESGGREEQAFAEHLRTHLSIGLECQYTQPEGRIWE